MLCLCPSALPLLQRILFAAFYMRIRYCRVTNPHEFELDGVTFLGTSGQNIDDIYKYSDEESRLALLQRVLQWGHMVPTAPDTLTCYPLSDNDPFILQSAPHVFFVGNQPSYSSHVIKGKLSAPCLHIAASEDAFWPA